MPPTPLDLAYTLPESWVQDLLTVTPKGSEAPLIAWVQEVVRSKGELSLALEPVQDLALATTNRRKRPSRLSRALAPVLERLTAAADGGWPVELPLAERREGLPAKHVFDLAADFDSLWAEWYVLDYLIGRGARPARSPRIPGGFDWFIDREGQRTNVEVKQKLATSEVGYRLGWFWKGMSLLPRAAFVKQFQWSWDVPRGIRAASAKQMMDGLHESIDELPGALADGLEAAAAPRSWDFERILGQGQIRLRTASFPSNASLAIEATADRSLRCFVSRNPDARVLDSTGLDGAWMLERLGEAEKRVLQDVVRRLGIERQARQRGQAGLFVVAWWVPHEWESAIDSAWLDEVCEGLASECQVPHLAVWPLGLFESARLPWGLSAAAQRDYAWLRDGRETPRERGPLAT